MCLVVFQEVKHPRKVEKVKSFEDDNNSEGTLKLFGKWQLEPLQLPHAVDGKVPKVLHVNSFVL